MESNLTARSDHESLTEQVLVGSHPRHITFLFYFKEVQLPVAHAGI